ncbi:hypothetical protein [Natronobeatus ordinarius]|uniref:hypothetical protein n=1 Tax=Natronobeatus ordinarius TaxID=2963433 RepID=UPI0020CEB016|nr:hypothetical protein [Natronobeatus ordinarius]
MSDLTAFGLEPQDPADDEPIAHEESDESAIWAACLDCEYVGYEVSTRFGQSVPLCPDCFAEREGLA